PQYMVLSSSGKLYSLWMKTSPYFSFFSMRLLPIFVQPTDEKTILLFSLRFFYDAFDMAPRANNPSWNSAAEVLGALLPHLPIAGRVQEYRVWEVWEEAVGEAVARKARPSKIRNGRLVVIASNSAYLQELQFYK